MTSPSALSVLLFDMDGVLVDVSGSYRRAIEETAAFFTGQPVEAGTVQRYKNRGGFNDDWKLTHTIIQESGVDATFDAVVDEFQKRYRGANWEGFISEEKSLISDDTLASLAAGGIAMAIVTGRPEEEAAWTVRRFGWEKYFPLIVAREQQDSRYKPDPYPVLHAMAELRAVGIEVLAERCAYVGDTVDDMVAARAAGVGAIGFVPPYLDREVHTRILRERGAQHVIEDMMDLPPLVAEFATGPITEA
jgi:HAD superfamily phosphatase